MSKQNQKEQSIITESGEKVIWRHPGGKFRRLGPETCSDAELLEKFDSFKGLANQPFAKLYYVKGLKEVKVTRIAAAFEIARRIVR